MLLARGMGGLLEGWVANVVYFVQVSAAVSAGLSNGFYFVQGLSAAVSVGLSNVVYFVQVSLLSH